MKKYFRVVLKGPHPVVIFDMEVPENASLVNLWANITMQGTLVTEKFCIAYDQIAHISFITVEQAQVFKPQFVQ